MSTLSERLREYATDHRWNVQPIVRATCAEASDEIERLRAMLREIQSECREWQEDCEQGAWEATELICTVRERIDDALKGQQ